MPDSARRPAATDAVADSVLDHWSRFRTAVVTRVHDGLINDTYRVCCADGSEAILQRLHPVFGAKVNLDIAAVTAELHSHGLATPELIPTDAGELWCEHEGRTWRALTHIGGRSLHKLARPGQLREAGALVARFHAALDGFRHDYHFRRGRVHDTAGHLKRLRTALQRQTAHPLHSEVLAHASPLLAATLPIPDAAALPARHCHGDLKVSNILFEPNGDRALCLIDLDTLGPMIWPFEMGDALRSWCNPQEEDAPGAALKLELLDAALRGYAEAAPPLTAEERSLLIGGVAQIAMELAARFLADALEESYFGWDPRRYPSRGHHNVARGSSMAELYADVLAKRAAAEAIVRRRLR